MLTASNISLSFGKRTLFKDVNLQFDGDNCYGLIGANGSGKSTFLRILSGELEPTSGDVFLGRDERLSVLKQNHNEFDEFRVIDTVIMGDSILYDLMKEKDAIYLKDPFTDKDGIRAGELEAKFADMDGWSAESNAAILLNGLGVSNDLHDKLMNELTDNEKIKVLLASALFGEPDILLLDEPTNGLDIESKMWLEDFLMDFKNTVIVVSHDRYFLNKVCTYMVDIDYEEINLFVGNYDFWYESSQLIQKQKKDSNKKKSDKIAELQDFIARFSANASKSKQATSRKRALDKINLEDMKASSRRYPFINFEMERPLGRDVLTIENLTLEVDGDIVLKNFKLNVTPGEKIAFIGSNERAKTALFEWINGNIGEVSGSLKMGTTVTSSYFPKNHDHYFEDDITLVDWLRNYSIKKEETFVRGFLGRMLFSGEEALKKVNVLSGGEKVRCMLSRMMLETGNLIILDEPTDHLDIESITALNDGLKKFGGSLLISTFDSEIIHSTADRIIEIHEDGSYTDKMMTYEQYLETFGKRNNN